MKNKTINIVTLGCSKNIVDSEKLMKQIHDSGHNVIHDAEETDAETVIINTCGFVKDAQEESIDTILKFVKAREEGYIKNLYVMGCLSERYMHLLKHEIPEVNRYFGVNSTNDILRELKIDGFKGYKYERTLTGPGHYAYLKISEGCDRKCAFCAIPMIRGKYVSRPIEELFEEALKLAGMGVKELILIAQDLTYYGLDIYKKQSLSMLLKELLKIDSFEWIRLHYLYPSNFPADLISVIRDNPRICRYIDIPIQHISDDILKIMKRSHYADDTKSILNKLRSEIPGVAIRTTLIAGHPGETEESFEEMKELVKDFRFDRLGVFSYSHEEDTYAFKHYKDEIAESIKQSRVSELMDIQQNISEELNNQKIGEVLKVIIDSTDGSFYSGRTEHDSPEVDQEVLIDSTKHNLNIGEFYNILITDIREFDLFGVPIL